MRILAFTATLAIVVAVWLAFAPIQTGLYLVKLD
jgi:hypothetical protein